MAVYDNSKFRRLHRRLRRRSIPALPHASSTIGPRASPQPQSPRATASKRSTPRRHAPYARIPFFACPTSVVHTSVCTFRILNIRHLHRRSRMFRLPAHCIVLQIQRSPLKLRLLPAGVARSSSASAHPARPVASAVVTCAWASSTVPQPPTFAATRSRAPVAVRAASSIFVPASAASFASPAAPRIGYPARCKSAGSNSTGIPRMHHLVVIHIDLQHMPQPPAGVTCVTCPSINASSVRLMGTADHMPVRVTIFHPRRNRRQAPTQPHHHPLPRSRSSFPASDQRLSATGARLRNPFSVRRCPKLPPNAPKPPQNAPLSPHFVFSHPLSWPVLQPSRSAGLSKDVVIVRNPVVSRPTFL